MRQYYTIDSLQGSLSFQGMQQMRF